MTQLEDDELALSVAKYDKGEGDMIVLNKRRVVLTLLTRSERKQVDSNLCYLHNGEVII